MYGYSNCMYSNSDCVSFTVTVYICVPFTATLCTVTETVGNTVSSTVLVNDTSIITVKKINPEDFERE